MDFLGHSCHLALKTLFTEVHLPDGEARDLGSSAEATLTCVSSLTYLTDEAQVSDAPQASVDMYNSSSSSFNSLSYCSLRTVYLDGKNENSVIRG